MSKSKKSIEAIYPCTPLQAGMVFHTADRSSPGLYIEQLGCLIKGSVDLSVLERACNMVMDRHMILRTVFAWKNVEQPVQVVKREVASNIRLVDGELISEDFIQKRLKEIREEDRSEGFALTKAPLWRLTVVSLCDKRFYLMLSYHHALLDGWSLSLLIKELFIIYRLLSSNSSVALGKAVGFSTYIAWVQRQDFSIADRIWQDFLEGFTSPTPLPGISVNNTKKSQRQAEQSFSLQLNEELTATITHFLKQQQLTLNTLVQAAWGLLLSTYTGSNDVVFGATVSGRPPSMPGIEEVLGLFINTLPVRISVNGHDTIEEMLDRIQRDGVRQREYDFIPLSTIQRDCDIPPGVSLFQTLAIVENIPTPQSMGSSGTSSSKEYAFLSVDYESQTHYPLVLTVVPGASLKIQLFYDGELYGETRIAQLARHFLGLMVKMCAGSITRVSELCILSDREKEKILLEWNDTKSEFESKGIHENYTRRAGANPGVKVIVGNESDLTYKELDEQANHMAGYLASKGVAHEDRVGVVLERSSNLVACLLGILKAGGCYVPIDPEYPSERIQHMLNHSGVRLVLTQDSLVERLKAVDVDIETVSIDRDWRTIMSADADSSTRFVSTRQIAYISYTSGSTGKPKGVAVTHENVVKLAFGAYVRLASGCKVLAAASIAFDASTFEVWGSLLRGCTVVLYQHKVPTPDSMRTTIQSHNVQVAWLTSSMFNSLIDADPQCLSGLEQILVGGEALSVQHVKQAYDALPGIEIINGYGPTEATTFSATYSIPRDADEPGIASIPIGKPIANTTLYVLDRHMNPVPAGARGELYIGGLGVARGYHEYPGLTAERFIADPFGGDQGARMYRTGDFVRYSDTGNLEYLGRMDDQVKIRGFRVELGEIEAALIGHPGIQRAVAVVQDDNRGNKCIIAYLILRPEYGSNIVAELSTYLRSRLPKYMIPSIFLTVDALPLTRNGKIDHKALKEKTDERTDESDIVRPRNLTEETLADIWRSLLGSKMLSMKHNFFDIGGHSLLVARLFALIERELKVALPVNTIFESPTIELLAQKIQANQGAEQTSHIVPIRPIGSDTPLIFIHPAAGDVLCYLRLARRLRKNGYAYPIYGIQATTSEVDYPDFDDLESMARYYIKELKSIRPTGPYMLIGYSMGGVVAFEMARQLSDSGESPSFLGLIDTFIPNGVLPEHDAEYMARFFSKGVSIEELRQLSQGDLMDAFKEKVTRSGILPPNADSNQAQRCFNIIKHNINVTEYYKPKPYQGTINFFLAEGSRPSKSRRDSSLGWRQLANGGLKVYRVPCNHHSVVRIPQCVQSLAKSLQEAISGELTGLEEELR